MKEIFNYVVRRINASNGKWEIVTDSNDFQYDDKLIVSYNPSETKLDVQLSEEGQSALKEFFVAKAEEISSKHLSEKSLQVNYRRETEGLIVGNYPDKDNTQFVKCFGTFSYAKGSNIQAQLNY
tara:strand:- start:246 stop:617 length:372 start_codon:yes stop_codon:yes gene_type:complete